MLQPDNISCWWCGTPNTPLYEHCHECGAEGKKPKMNWDKVNEVFGEKGLPSCGLTDASILGGSDADDPATGTIFIGGD